MDYVVGLGGGAGGKSSAGLKCAARTVNWPRCGITALSATNTPGSTLLEIVTRSKRSSLLAEGVLKEGKQPELNRLFTPV